MTRAILLSILILISVQSQFAAAREFDSSLPNGFSTDKKARFKIDIINTEQSKILFNYFKHNPRIPHDFAVDGCHARATVMTVSAQAVGVIMAKIYAEGSLKVRSKDPRIKDISWDFHVAPAVFVYDEEKDDIELKVFDPSLFDEPVSKTKWTRKMSSLPGAFLKEVYYGQRFQYLKKMIKGAKDLEEREEEKTRWQAEDMIATRKTLKSYAHILKTSNTREEVNAKLVAYYARVKAEKQLKCMNDFYKKYEEALQKKESTEKLEELLTTECKLDKKKSPGQPKK